MVSNFFWNILFRFISCLRVHVTCEMFYCVILYIFPDGSDVLPTCLVLYYSQAQPVSMGYESVYFEHSRFQLWVFWGYTFLVFLKGSTRRGDYSFYAGFHESIMFHLVLWLDRLLNGDTLACDLNSEIADLEMLIIKSFLLRVSAHFQFLISFAIINIK